ETPVPSLRNMVVAGLNVTFTRAIAPATFEWRDITLTRDGGANLITSDVQVGRVSDTVYHIGNISWVQGLAGDYALTVNAFGVQDPAGNNGSGSVVQTWTIELTKPASPTQLRI